MRLPREVLYLWGAVALLGGAAVVVAKLTGRVLHRERAAGVDRRLLAFLDWWEDNGPFPITVLADGGVRTDAAKQRDLFAQGTSNAATLAQTPHGRRGAIDVAPVINGAVPWNDWAKFEAVGRLAKARGLVWGGDWKTLKDGPHLEVPDWRSLPMPGLPVA